MAADDEKKRIECATADLFLTLYNKQHGTKFEVKSLGDAPDVTCVDPQSGRAIFLEISLLEDLPGDVAYALGRAEKPLSPTTRMTAVSLTHDVIPNWRTRLEKKLLASYGKQTALVLRQVSPLWEAREWGAIAPAFRETVLKGKEANYGAGVWVICTDAATWPATDALFCLSEPTD